MASKTGRIATVAALVASLGMGAALPGPPAVHAYRVRSLADRVFARLDEARRDEGLPRWSRRPALDAAAAAAAAEIAATGGRGLDRPIDEFVRKAGIRDFRRAVPIVQSLRGYEDPVRTAVDHWKGYRLAWEALTDPTIDAIGMADATSPDGKLVLVGILLDAPERPVDPRELARETVEAVNRVRDRHGLSTLRRSAGLAKIARAHSRDMARRGYMDHESPEGRDVAWRAREAGISYRGLAENISRIRGFDDPVEAAVEGWMASPGHRGNILLADFTRTGVGVAVDDDGVIYFTQVFLEPPPTDRDRQD